MAADVFLLMKGVILTADPGVVVRVSFDVAQGKMEKPEIVGVLRKHSKKIRP